ncbi:MAG: FAD binding domain-containing protein [Pyrinomonadaceae bacterium]
MIEFIINNQDIKTDLPVGTTVLDFVRYRQNLKGTKIGCREGDCGACTILVGELINDDVKYRTMTSCLMPLANAAGKHIVTIEGINPEDGSLTPVQQAIIDESGTQCGFCTVGFVMSLTGFCLDETAKTPEMAVSSIDGNICRCTGYKSIERAAMSICGDLSEPPAVAGGLRLAIDKLMVPKYFSDVTGRIKSISDKAARLLAEFNHPLLQAVPIFVAGGTDVYVQKPDHMAESDAAHLFYDDKLRGISYTGEFIEIGASATVTDLLESPIMQSIFPDLYKHIKLISSTPIRNMSTLAGNFINASPIGDMTVWFLALNADIVLSSGREMLLKKLYLDYKKLAKNDDEFIRAIRVRKPPSDFYFNFEKVCKRTYLDIATVNTAISLRCETTPGKGWVPPVLSEPRALATGLPENLVEHSILDAHVAAGGVAPIPLYLKETSSFLIGRTVNTETIEKANEIIQLEISPISDVRGTEAYKRLLLRQLFTAHFVELFGIDLV